LSTAAPQLSEHGAAVLAARHDVDRGAAICRWRPPLDEIASSFTAGLRGTFDT
jgi:hypothetical protein